MPRDGVYSGDIEFKRNVPSPSLATCCAAPATHVHLILRAFVALKLFRFHLNHPMPPSRDRLQWTTSWLVGWLFKSSFSIHFEPVHWSVRDQKRAQRIPFYRPPLLAYPKIRLLGASRGSRSWCRSWKEKSFLSLSCSRTAAGCSFGRVWRASSRSRARSYLHSALHCQMHRRCYVGGQPDSSVPVRCVRCTG